MLKIAKIIKGDITHHHIV